MVVSSSQQRHVCQNVGAPRFAHQRALVNHGFRQRFRFITDHILSPLAL